MDARRTPCRARREVDYGYLLDDDGHAAARPAVAAPAGRRARALAHRTTPRLRLERPRLDRPPAGRRGASTSCTSARSPRRARSTPRSGGSTTCVDLGVDFVELMPVNAFNGTHNWGYDGVALVRRPRDLRRPGGATSASSTRCHAAGLGVIQDVVYNHLGPSGNYLPGSAPTSRRARNTWGDLVNLDGEGSAEVRRYILDNALMWLADYHVDGLRLDAVHALHDASRPHLLEELAVEVDALSARLGRPLTLIAESDLNDPVLVTPREAGGYGLDAQWSDDFHHALHVALTGETHGYYADFEPLARAGQGVRARVLPRRHLVVVPRARPRRARSTPDAMPTWRLVVCSQNHDQVGNRAAGDRLTEALDDDQLACAALLTLCSPVHADAVHGRGVGGLDAVPVLHLPPRAGARPGHRRGPDRGVRAARLGPRRRARPAGPGDLRALEAGLVGAASPVAGGGCSPSTASWPGCAASTPTLDRPVVRAHVAAGRRGGAGLHHAARRPARGGQLRRAAAGRRGRRRSSCSSRPSQASTVDGGSIRLPPHAGALVRLPGERSDSPDARRRASRLRVVGAPGDEDLVHVRLRPAP